jgi:hypothetical protein
VREQSKNLQIHCQKMIEEETTKYDKIMGKEKEDK